MHSRVWTDSGLMVAAQQPTEAALVGVAHPTTHSFTLGTILLPGGTIQAHCGGGAAGPADCTAGIEIGVLLKKIINRLLGIVTIDETNGTQTRQNATNGHRTSALR